MGKVVAAVIVVIVGFFVYTSIYNPEPAPARAPVEEPQPASGATPLPEEPTSSEDDVAIEDGEAPAEAGDPEPEPAAEEPAP